MKVQVTLDVFNDPYVPDQEERKYIYTVWNRGGKLTLTRGSSHGSPEIVGHVVMNCVLVVEEAHE